MLEIVRDQFVDPRSEGVDEELPRRGVAVRSGHPRPERNLGLEMREGPRSVELRSQGGSPRGSALHAASGEHQSDRERCEGNSHFGDGILETRVG